ncbi:unnamed protein product [Owenia fusiformis]|uniref:L-aminoadipate-semialdehyde dehydrogenase-phosphopantetheinyl transferase n=1 Tax=Owenia fusiformis TaxID=6347 RepID=A0A8J1THS8_OWEFU|nr:unnamed protein product [Owenia fusiformis]
MSRLRWAFNCGRWSPSEAEWTMAAQCIQPEEKERIGKFVFKKDAKSSMAGRLLLRKVISETLNIPYKDVKLGRTPKGKPVLETKMKTGFPNFNFNVSHQGEYAVLAAEPVYQVGIDVMDIAQPRGSKSTAEFFDLMSRQFTDHEWSNIKQPTSEMEQLGMFYRHWCLKESYVKAFGIGIGFNLERLSFHVKTPLHTGVITSDTTFHIDGELDPAWRFEETKLDEKHCVAVGICTDVKQINRNCGNVIETLTDSEEYMEETVPSFKMLTFKDLIDGAEALTEPDELYWKTFNAKDEMPRRWKDT